MDKSLGTVLFLIMTNVWMWESMLATWLRPSYCRTMTPPKASVLPATPSQTHTYTDTPCSPSHTDTHQHKHTLLHSLSYYVTQTVSLSLLLSNTDMYSLPLSPFLSSSLSHTHTHTHSHAHIGRLNGIDFGEVWWLL